MLKIVLQDLMAREMHNAGNDDHLMIRNTQLYQILGGDISWTSLLCPWTGSSYDMNGP